MSNSLEQDKLPRELGNFTEEDKNWLRSSIWNNRKELIRIGFVMLIEAIIIFLYINPISIKLNLVKYDIPINFKIRNWQLLICFGTLHLIVLYMGKLKEIKAYFNRKSNLIWTFQPKDESQAAFVNEISNNLFKDSANVVIRHAIKIWIP